MSCTEHIELIIFKNLKELLKTQQTHYILKYDLDEKESVYYTLVSTSTYEILAFCFDENFHGDYLKEYNGKFVATNELSANGIALAQVETDTILEQVLDKLQKQFEKEEKKHAKPKK